MRQQLQNIFLLALMVGITQAIFSHPDKNANITGWTILFNDQFDLQEIDTNKWSYESGNGNQGWGNNETQLYTDSKKNIYTSEGKLVIQADKEKVAGSTKITSARITTQGKYSVTYGKFEMKAKFPRAPGFTTAFFLMGQSVEKVNWPDCGEIVIAELTGKDQTHLYSAVVGKGLDMKHGHEVQADFWKKFHIFGAIWTPFFIEFTIDGQPYKRLAIENEGKDKEFFEGNPMFLNIALSVGGNWAGSPAEDQHFPQKLLIDWIRVSKPIFDTSAEKFKEMPNITQLINVTAHEHIHVIHPPINTFPNAINPTNTKQDASVDSNPTSLNVTTKKFLENAPEALIR